MKDDNADLCLTKFLNVMGLIKKMQNFNVGPLTLTCQNCIFLWNSTRIVCQQYKANKDYTDAYYICGLKFSAQKPKFLNLHH